MSRILRPSSIRSAVRQYATISDAAVGGVKVAAIDAGQPTSSVTVVVKAGSRFETTPGVAHCLKNFAFKVRVNTLERGVRREMRTSATSARRKWRGTGWKRETERKRHR
jgi:ubiquinol-cytochrome c reductase core subunit 2